jgi:hypothetical protein
MNTAAVVGRWVARIVGTLMVLVILTLLVGEGPPPLARMTARERLYALGLGVLYLGLIVAWFREGWGGLLSVLGWLFLAVLDKPPWHLPFTIPAAAGVLHVLCWWKLRGGPLPKAFRLGALLWVSALVPLFLLCANEILGQPPWMTRTGPPPAELVGTWRDGPIQFTIAPDGRVSGAIGQVALKRGRIGRNRSWLGRLLNWRTEFLIRGVLASGGNIAAPLNPSGPELHGWLLDPGGGKLALRLRKAPRQPIS